MKILSKWRPFHFNEYNFHPNHSWTTGVTTGVPNSHFHGKYMVHFTFLCHKMSGFTISQFSTINFQVEASKKRSWKICQHHHFMKENDIFHKFMAKNGDFMIKTRIANHKFTSIVGRFNIFTHEKPLFHASRNTYCSPRMDPDDSRYPVGPMLLSIPAYIIVLQEVLPEINSNKGIDGSMQKRFNPLHANFFRVNINIYLHFMSLLHIDTTQVVGTLPQVR